MLQEAKRQIELPEKEIDELCTPSELPMAMFTRPTRTALPRFWWTAKRSRSTSIPIFDAFALEEGPLRRVEQHQRDRASGYIGRGGLHSVVDFLGDHRDRTRHADEERVVTLASPLRREAQGRNNLLVDPARLRPRELPKSAWRRSFSRDPGCDLREGRRARRQIQILRDSIKLPYCSAEIFANHELSPPGHSALRPPGLWQDAHRKGDREQPGEEHRCARARRPQPIPRCEGARALEQVRRGDRVQDS